MRGILSESSFSGVDSEPIFVGIPSVTRAFRQHRATTCEVVSKAFHMNDNIGLVLTMMLCA